MPESISRGKLRVLFVGESLTLSHIVRPLHLAQSLDIERFEVHFACGEYSRKLVQSSGITWHNLLTLTPEIFQKRIATAIFPLYSFHELVDYVEAERKLLKTLKPDLIIHDFRHTLATSASLEKIPLISLTDACWSPFSTQEFPLPETILAKFISRELLQQLAKPILSLALSIHLRPYQRLRKWYHLKTYSSLRHIYTEADVTLYQDIPSLAPTFDLAANHHYIGPIFWQPNAPIPEWFSLFPQEKPLIYVSMGSSGNTTLLRKIIVACQNMPLNVIITTAGRKLPFKIPKNVFVAEFIPALEVIKQCALVICHGGSAVAYQALRCGTPFIGIPSNISQFFFMDAAAPKKVGILLTENQVNSQTIRRTIQQLLSNTSWRENAGHFQQEIIQYDSIHLFQKYLMEYCETHLKYREGTNT